MSSEDKVAIVTGASRGIGAGIVSQFLAKGYRIVACPRKIATTGQPNLIEVAGGLFSNIRQRFLTACIGLGRSA